MAIPELRRTVFDGESRQYLSSGSADFISQNMALYPSTMGALTQLYAGTMPEAAELGGKVSLPSYHPTTNTNVYTTQ